MADSAYNLGTRKHVFIDWDLIEPGYGVSFGGETPEPWEMPHGVRLAVHYPRIDPKPIVWPDKPWEKTILFFNTLLEDDGRYRLYYQCWDWDRREDPEAFALACAESTDGVNWVKPNVGAIDFQGSTDNNLVHSASVESGRPVLDQFVFVDPSCAPEERYKLVSWGRENGTPSLFGSVSADGLRWRPIEKPLLYDYMCDTQNVVRFDPAKGKYVGYFRGWSAYEKGKLHGRRTIAYAETDRFESWPVPETVVSLDANDDPDADIYTNSYSPWPGADAHLMFPVFYRRTLDVGEVHMMTSRDGVRWHRPTRRAIIPSGEPNTTGDRDRDWRSGVYSGCGIVSLRPGEWSLPVHPRAVSHNQHYFPEGKASPPHHGYICLATWRQDGFMSLEAETEGACTTVPITFSGSRLEVNAWTRFGGEIRIEVLDASGDLRGRGRAPAVAGFTFDDCDPISGDNLKGTVTWRGESDLSAWAGEPVRLRLQMRRARLYALQFA